jgi:hypothetical protein
MKRLIIVLLVLSFTNSIKANAVITAFTAQKTGDSVQFNWTANEDNMFYYEVMEVINVNGSEKMLIHTDVTNSGQTSGMTYQESAAMTRVLMVGFQYGKWLWFSFVYWPLMHPAKKILPAQAPPATRMCRVNRHPRKGYSG